MGSQDWLRIADRKISDVVLREIGRARVRVVELQQAYPTAERRELAQRLADGKKALAATEGAVSGLFGLAGLPADLLVVSYLQLALLVEIALLYRQNLNSQRARDELLDLFGFANGLGPLVRSGPRVLGRIAVRLFERGGWPRLGRAVPVLAAPVTAFFNNRDLQRVADEAVRFYGRRWSLGPAADDGGPSTSGSAEG